MSGANLTLYEAKSSPSEILWNPGSVDALREPGRVVGVSDWDIDHTAVSIVGPDTAPVLGQHGEGEVGARLEVQATWHFEHACSGFQRQTTEVAGEGKGKLSEQLSLQLWIAFL